MQKPLVVVGVDGSSEADAALRWAADEAKVRRARLRVVHVWTYPVAANALGMASVGLGFEDLHRQAAHLVAQELVRTIGPNPGVSVDVVIQQGSPETLVELSAEADLLVVGTRGLGPVSGLLLGSFSRHCVHHARCAVVVVPSGFGNDSSPKNERMADESLRR